MASIRSVNWWRFSPSQILEKYQAHAFDRRFGTDTSTYVELRGLDVAGSNKRHGERYQPSPVHSLRQLLKKLAIRYQDFVFVDFGSGKGRTLLVAGELPFKEVIGVEFSEELHRKALLNLQRYPRRAAGQVKSVHADATAFEAPAQPLVVYFFNPFTRPVLERVLANLAASAVATPRRIIVIYLYLPDETWLAELSGFRLRKKVRNYHVFDFDPPVPVTNFGTATILDIPG